ncbi:hypothetical protein Leryth_006088 [Lithospermum erythrorhizon]|nr:hypothetical protein Leryth_006088 [Lithospermum erythrorhizon]
MVHLEPLNYKQFQLAINFKKLEDYPQAIQSAKPFSNVYGYNKTLHPSRVYARDIQLEEYAEEWKMKIARLRT